jgi:hypothetical protein
VWDLLLQQVQPQVQQQLLALAQQPEAEQRQVKRSARLPEVLPPARVQSTALLRVSAQVQQLQVLSWQVLQR